MSSRGARNSRGGRPEPSDYDAMEDHYNSENNSYVTSSGTELKYSRIRDGDNSIKLHITNIPATLTENGLLNAFSAEGLEPLGAYIGAPKGTSGLDTKWGFVSFSRVTDAQAAITAVNRKPPHCLHVKFALSNEEKLERERNRHERDRDNDSVKSSTLSTMTRGRGQLPPMQGKPPSEFRSTRVPEEQFYNDLNPDDHYGNRFSHPDSSHDISNAVHSPFADGYYEDDGTRKMSMGRGSYIGSTEKQEYSRRPTVTRYHYPDVQDEMDTKVAAYISKKFKELSCEDNFKITSDARLTLPFKLGSCAYCSRPSIYCCSRCKIWYCSNSCREDDFPQHRKICAPRTLVFGKDGNVGFSNNEEMFADVEEPTALMNCNSPRNNYVKSPNTGPQGLSDYPPERNGFGHKDGDFSLGDNQMNKGERRPREMNRNKESPRDSNKQNQRDSNRDNPRGKHRDSRDNQQDSRDNQRDSSDYQRDSRDNQRGNRDNQRDNRFNQRDSDNRDNCSEFNRDSQHDFSKRDNQKNNTRDSAGNRGNRNSNPINDSHQGGKRNGGRNDRRSGRDQKNVNNVCIRPLMPPSEDYSQNNKSFNEKPPIPENAYTEVIVGGIGENQNEFYAYSGLVLTEQADLMKEIESLSKEASAVLKTVAVGDIVGAPFTGMWFRAKVTQVRKSDVGVVFIDFGNEEIVEKSELRRLPDKLIKKPALAHKFKLLVSPDNPEIAEEVTLKLKPIGQDENNSWIVRAENVNYPGLEDEEKEPSCEAVASKPEIRKKVGHLLYNLANTHNGKILIEKVMNEEFLTGSILNTNEPPTCLRVSASLKESIIKLDPASVTMGMSVAALWDDDWHRGYVMLIRDKDIIVALIDRGRVVIPKALAVLPKFINSVPESGVRAIFRDPLNDLNMAGHELTVTFIKQEEEKVHVQVENLGEAVLVPWEPAIEEAGLNCVRIASKSDVVIASYTSPKAVYVSPNSIDDKKMRAELMQDIATHCLTCEPLNRKPLCGEFLAARFSEDRNYYRAQIYAREGDFYKVTFVDFGNTSLVKVSDMKPLSDELKLVPCWAVKVGLKGVPNVAFNTRCMTFLNKLCANSVDLCITYDRDLSEVNLELHEGELLNQKLAKLLKPSWGDSAFSPHEGHVFMADDLIYEEWFPDERFEIGVVKVLGLKELAVLRTKSNLIEYIEKTLTPNITTYCEQFPDETYNPRSNEVCLAKFHEDGNWYRAICFKSFSHNASEVTFVDYGNTGQVLHRCIRKMVKEFMETPVALKVCQVFGIPDKLPEGVASKLCEYYTSQKHTVEVMEDENDMPRIWIPALKDFGKKCGFMVKSP